ncbi:Dynactin [Salix suchowensis]|nr:Dynactin [Salix suchowensis]
MSHWQRISRRRSAAPTLFFFLPITSRLAIAPPSAVSMSSITVPLPASPPPTQSNPASPSASHTKEAETFASFSLPPEPPVVAPTIDPELSLELRLRWLEALILGTKYDHKGKETEPAGTVAGSTRNELKQGETLVRAVEDIQKSLNLAVENNDGSRSSWIIPSYSMMSPEELEAFITEMEPEIRAADHDMREIEALSNKGVLNAGKLADHEALRPRLDAVVKAYEEDLERAAALEHRLARLMERNATLVSRPECRIRMFLKIGNQVDALSELFVIWDDAITNAEARGKARTAQAGAETPRDGIKQTPLPFSFSYYTHY